jgi:hypothetical protein
MMCGAANGVTSDDLQLVGRLRSFRKTCQAVFAAVPAAIMNGIHSTNMACFDDNGIAGRPHAADIEGPGISRGRGSMHFDFRVDMAGAPAVLAWPAAMTAAEMRGVEFA